MSKNYEEIARGNVERYLSDAVLEDGEDAIFDTAYTLAVDALIDAGAPLLEAQEIAMRVAQAFAQP